MSRDIVPGSDLAQGLVVAARVKDQRPEQLSVLGQDPHVQVSDEHQDSDAPCPEHRVSHRTYKDGAARWGPLPSGGVEPGP